MCLCVCVRVSVFVCAYVCVCVCVFCQVIVGTGSEDPISRLHNLDDSSGTEFRVTTFRLVCGWVCLCVPACVFVFACVRTCVYVYAYKNDIPQLFLHND